MGPSQTEGGNSEVYWNTNTQQWNIISTGCEECEFFLTHQGYNIFYTDTSWKGFYENIDTDGDGIIDKFIFHKNIYGYNEEHPAHNLDETEFTLKNQPIAYSMAEYDDDVATGNAYLQSCCDSTIWDSPPFNYFYNCDCGSLEGFNGGDWNSPVNGEDYQYYYWPLGSDTTDEEEIDGPSLGYVWASCESGCVDIDSLTYNMICLDNTGNDTGDTSQDCK